MAKKRGFTIVELVVVMTIMGILLTLGIVGLGASQANARDTERKSDIEAIAKGLESRYVQGNIFGVASYITKGTYPSVYELQHAQGQSVSTITPNQQTQYLEQILNGTRTSNFFPPGAESSDITATFKPICTSSCAAAENAAQRDAAANTPGVYVYEPITATGAVCLNTACVRYNLYYRLETSSATVQKKESLRQ